MQRAVAIPVAGARGLVGYVASGDRVDIYYETGSSGGTILGLLAPNVLVMRAPAADGSPAILRRRRRPRPEARARVRLRAPCGSCCARPATRRTPRRSRSRAPSSSRRSQRTSGRSTDGHARSAHSSPSRASTSSTSSGPCPTTRSFELVGVTDGVDETVRSLQEREVDVRPRRLPGPRGRPVAPDHRRRAPARLPDCRSSCSRPSSPNGFLRRAFEAGAADMALFPQSKEQLALRDEQGDRPPPRGAAEAAASDAGRLVCVLGPKGGTGKTLTSSNLAVALALAGQRCSSSTSTSSSATSGSALGLPPETTIYDLAVSGGTLDAEKLDAYLMTHASGVGVLLAPSAARPGRARSRSSSCGTSTRRCARRYDFVVVDTPPGFTAEVIATIDAVRPRAWSACSTRSR